MRISEARVHDRRGEKTTAVVLASFCATCTNTNSEVGPLSTFSIQTGSDISPIEEEGDGFSPEEEGDGFSPAIPSPSEPEAGEEEEMRRSTAEPFAPARATPGRRPLFRN